MKYLSNIIVVLAITLLINTGCKKLIEVDTPQNQLTTDKVFKDTTAVNAALVSIYAQLDYSIDPNYNKFLGLYTDELIYPTSTVNEFYTSNLSTNNTNVLNIWKNNYFVIYSCNDLITQLQSANSIPVANKTSLTAEAQFLRAYAYFYLVNSFGAVPLVLTTDINQTSHIARIDSATVYTQILADLKAAQSNLPVNYIGGEKVRANKRSATALLSRVYLYQRDWSGAEASATSVINSGIYTLNPVVSDVFLANSQESILQCWKQYGYITDGRSLIPRSGAATYPLSTNLVNAFEPGDLRKANWLNSTTVNATTYYYPYKYHNRTNNTSSPEYLMILRLAEQFLIRAEARIQQGNIAQGIADLNVIRSRAGLPAISTTISKSAALNAVTQERRIEFFMEWGSRYLDLKRTGRLSAVMSAYRTSWSSRAILLPIPQNEITLNSNLIQNSGY